MTFIPAPQGLFLERPGRFGSYAIIAWNANGDALVVGADGTLQCVEDGGHLDEMSQQTFVPAAAGWFAEINGETRPVIGWGLPAVAGPGGLEDDLSWTQVLVGGDGPPRLIHAEEITRTYLEPVVA